MPIQKKSRRKMSPIARKAAKLHNECYRLAKQLLALADDIQNLEMALREQDNLENGKNLMDALKSANPFA